MDSVSSDDEENVEFDKNLATKFEDDGFGSYESNSSSRSIFIQVTIW